MNNGLRGGFWNREIARGQECEKTEVPRKSRSSKDDWVGGYAGRQLLYLSFDSLLRSSAELGQLVPIQSGMHFIASSISSSASDGPYTSRITIIVASPVMLSHATVDSKRIVR